MTLTVQGEVERITFENETTGFRVVRLCQVSGAQGKSQLTIVGSMPALGPGMSVRVAGRLDDDKKHGTRLLVQSLVVIAPETLAGLEKYLGSGILPGIGPSLAKRIVNCFGLATLHTLDTQSHRLSEVPGMGKKKVEAARSAWAEHQAMSNTLLALQNHGVTATLAKKIVDQFGARAAETVENHPYRLALDVVGVGFKTADQIARVRGLPADHPERAQAGLFHQLIAARDQGHCYVDRDQLLERSAEMLQIDAPFLESALDQLWATGRVTLDESRVYLRNIWEAEQRVAERVVELTRAPVAPALAWADKLLRFEQQAGLSLGEAQRAAIKSACEHKFIVITGGPGVGKTTLVRALLEVIPDTKARVLLAAPTGRAAQRLAESTGRRAVTLHRLLEGGAGSTSFVRNAEHPLEVDLLIIDEASMIDIHLAKSLFEAIPNAARLIVVGDADQLPSVGPGAVLLDLIASAALPVVRLTEVFRQGKQSGIVENSHRILHGEPPSSANDQDGDFFVIKVNSNERARKTLHDLMVERIPQRFGFKPDSDIQVLCPMHRGELGTLSINHMLQHTLNPRGSALRFGEVEYRERDKVIQLKNDYNREVFNGDIGEVVQVDAANSQLTVQFDADEGQKLVTYNKADLGQLGLSYCISVHKSQGSEYPAVVVVLLSAHYMMLSRNLLYTAVTRAKRLCVLVTDDRALRLALAEVRKESRATRLAEQIRARVLD